MKVAIFAFRGDTLCFIHVMLNALDMNRRGIDTKVILEGESVTLIQSMRVSGNKLFEQLVSAGLVDCVCKACSAKMGVLAYNESSGIRLCDEMNGHPAMATYLEQGYTIITQ